MSGRAGNGLLRVSEVESGRIRPGPPPKRPHTSPLRPPKDLGPYLGTPQSPVAFRRVGLAAGPFWPLLCGTAQGVLAVAPGSGATGCAPMHAAKRGTVISPGIALTWGADAKAVARKHRKARWPHPSRDLRPRARSHLGGRPTRLTPGWHPLPIGSGMTRRPVWCVRPRSPGVDAGVSSRSGDVGPGTRLPIYSDRHSALVPRTHGGARPEAELAGCCACRADMRCRCSRITWPRERTRGRAVAAGTRVGKLRGFTGLDDTALPVANARLSLGSGLQPPARAGAGPESTQAPLWLVKTSTGGCFPDRVTAGCRGIRASRLVMPRTCDPSSFGRGW